MIVPLLNTAYDIIKRQAVTSNNIFPYCQSAFSKRFVKIKKNLNIQDFRYHDLRREGVSRLFEMGHNLENVASVTAVS